MTLCHFFGLLAIGALAVTFAAVMAELSYAVLFTGFLVTLVSAIVSLLLLPD